MSKLRSAGYTDDEIYELTVATAMGVGLNRFKVGLRALGDEALLIRLRGAVSTPGSGPQEGFRHQCPY